MTAASQQTLKAMVVSLHRQHTDWSAPQLANHLKCSRQFVYMVADEMGLPVPRKPYAKRKPGAAKQNPKPTLRVVIAEGISKTLRGEAERRGIGIEELAGKLLSAVARDQLVGAVLDDAPNREVAA